MRRSASSRAPVASLAPRGRAAVETALERFRKVHTRRVSRDTSIAGLHDIYRALVAFANEADGSAATAMSTRKRGVSPSLRHTAESAYNALEFIAKYYEGVWELAKAYAVPPRDFAPASTAFASLQRLVVMALPAHRQVIERRFAQLKLPVSGFRRAHRRGRKSSAASEGRSSKGKNVGIKIFISHSSKDAKLAKALIDLIESGAEVPDGAIRCTSVPGYELAGGDSAAAVLRANLNECAVVLGMLTKLGLASPYVLIELGAAWGFEKTAVPLLAPGVTFDKLPGPFSDIHALRLDDDASMAGLVRTICTKTRLARRDNPPKVQTALERLREAVREVSVRDGSHP
jgi:hypothetical protein